MTDGFWRPYFSGFTASRSSSFCFCSLQLFGVHGEQEQAGVVELLLLDKDVGGLQPDGLLLEARIGAFLERAPDLEGLIPVRFGEVVERLGITVGEGEIIRREFGRVLESLPHGLVELGAGSTGRS